MGRTRFLDEAAVLARLAGATVITADASASRQLHGTAQAIVARLFELLPEAAHVLSPQFHVALA